MLENQNPFSLYDFLGYLIPGGFFLFGITLIPLPEFYKLHYAASFLNPDSVIARLSFTSALFLIMLSYIIGHILSYISSMTIEKYSIWTIGYPSKYLFDKNIRPSWKAGFRLYFADYYCSANLVTDHKRSIPGLLQVGMQRFLVFLFLSPFAFPVIMGAIALGMNDAVRKVLSEQLSKEVKRKINLHLKRIDLETECECSSAGEMFRILYHYSIEKFPVHKEKMQNYVALYGFCRTVSLVFVIFFWWFAVYYFDQVSIFYFLNLCLLCFMATIFYLAFNKFFRKFSLECYMAVASQSPDKCHNGDVAP